MEFVEWLYGGTWLAVLALTLLCSKALEEAVWLIRNTRVAEPSADGLPLVAGARVSFSGYLLRAGKRVSELDWIGEPTTLMLVVPKDIGSGQSERDLMTMANLLVRRSVGRLCVLCKGSNEECSALDARLATLPKSAPVVVFETGNTLSSVFPIDGTVVAVNLAGDGSVLGSGRSHRRESVDLKRRKDV